MAAVEDFRRRWRRIPRWRGRRFPWWRRRSLWLQRRTFLRRLPWRWILQRTRWLWLAPGLWMARRILGLSTLRLRMGIGFWLWWPYWGWGYPFSYGYRPWNYAPEPYHYPYYCPPGYTCPPNGNDDPPAPNPSPKSGSNPAKPWRPPVSTPNTNYTTTNVAALTPRDPFLSTDRITITPSNYQVAHSTTRQNPPVRHEVQSAMRALREMPPFAREREIETGRYSHFSPEERELLRSIN